MKSPNSIKKESLNILRDFQNSLIPLMKLFGTSTEIHNEKQFAWEFFRKRA